MAFPLPPGEVLELGCTKVQPIGRLRRSRNRDQVVPTLVSSFLAQFERKNVHWNYQEESLNFGVDEKLCGRQAQACEVESDE